jgi:hypothetical protein
LRSSAVTSTANGIIGSRHGNHTRLFRSGYLA